MILLLLKLQDLSISKHLIIHCGIMSLYSGLGGASPPHYTEVVSGAVANLPRVHDGADRNTPDPQGGLEVFFLSTVFSICNFRGCSVSRQTDFRLGKESSCCWEGSNDLSMVRTLYLFFCLSYLSSFVYRNSRLLCLQSSSLIFKPNS